MVAIHNRNIKYAGYKYLLTKKTHSCYPQNVNFLGFWRLKNPQNVNQNPQKDPKILKMSTTDPQNVNHFLKMSTI